MNARQIRAVGAHLVGRPGMTFGLALVSLLPGLTACGSGSPEGLERESSFTRSDSVGIVLAITRGEGPRSPLGWQVDTLPELVIGAADSLFLHRVQGLVGGPDGGVLVVNGGMQQLWFFDASGRLLKRIGGNGEGPGEFRDPVLVPWVGSDSLLIFDTLIPRLQVFSAEGEYQRTIRYPQGFPAGAGRRPPLGAAGLDALLFEHGHFVGGESSLRRVGLHKHGREYVWYDPATAKQTPVDSVVYDLGYTSPHRPDVLWRVAFSSRPAAVVASDGVLMTNGRSFEIREYDQGARLRRILRVMQPDRPVTREMIVRRDPVTMTPDHPIPETLPAFWSLVIDSRGWLWAEVFNWEQDVPRRPLQGAHPSVPKEWMVFDAEGQARGTVRTPAGLDVAVIGDDYVIGIWRDQFDVQQVHRHVLRRAGSRAITAERMP